MDALAKKILEMEKTITTQKAQNSGLNKEVEAAATAIDPTYF